MTRIKISAKWLLPVVVLLLLAVLFGAVPAYAAESEGDGTSGETEATVNFTAGELKLVSVPVLDFGSHDITDTEQSYTAESISPQIQVSDLRGSGKGWDLMVSLSPFRLQEGGETTLKAASISITGPTVNAVNGTVGTPPAAVANVTLSSDSTETPVLTAAIGEGMGVWDLVWSKATTKLNVKPGTAQKGTSVASLTWTLQTTP